MIIDLDKKNVINVFFAIKLTYIYFLVMHHAKYVL